MLTINGQTISEWMGYYRP